MKHLRLITRLAIIVFLVNFLIIGNFNLTVWAEDSEGDFTYDILPKSQTAVITAYSGSGSAVVPDKLGGLPVSQISSDAFYDLTRGQSLILPRTVELIGLARADDIDFSSFTLYLASGSTAEYYAEMLGITYKYIAVQSDGSYDFSQTPVSPFSDGTEGDSSLKLPSGYNGDGFFASMQPCSECGFQHISAKYSGDSGQVDFPSNAYRYAIRHYYDDPWQRPSPYCTQEKLGFPGSEEVLDALYQSYPVIAIDSCQSPNSVAIYLPDCIKHIEEKCFIACQNLQSFTLPPMVQELKYRTFAYCISLKQINLKSVEYIGEEAFFDCRSLTSLDLPGTLTKIEKGAFVGCDSLKSVTVPASVTEIGDYAFGYDTCDSGVPGSEEHILTNRRSAYTDFIIYGYSGSAAEEYCRRNDFIRFIPLDKKEERDEWTAVMEDIADSYASGEMRVTVPLTETTIVPEKVFVQIKAKENLTVDFVLNPEISWTIKSEDIGTPSDIEFKTIFTQAPEVLGKGISIQGAEKIFYLKLPEVGFACSESLNIELENKFDSVYSLEFLKLSSDEKSIEPMDDLTCTYMDDGNRRTYLRSSLPNSEYYLILHQNGYSTNFTEIAENKPTSPVGSGSSQTSNNSKTLPIIVTATLLVCSGAGLGVFLINKKKR